MRVRMSASLNSRMSLLSISVRLLSGDELRLHAELRCSERHCLARDFRSDSLELEHHSTWLHDSNPSFGRAFALSHSRLGRLFRYRFVGEDSDPHFSTALDVTSKRNTSSLDLSIRNPAGLERLQTVRAERDGRTARCMTARSSLEHFAKLYSLRTQHRSVS